MNQLFHSVRGSSTFILYFKLTTIDSKEGMTVTLCHPFFFTIDDESQVHYQLLI